MKLSLAIAALALYGDLLKRTLGATTALLVTYGAFGIIIAVCLAKGHSTLARHKRSPDRSFSASCIALISAYLLQFLTHPQAPLFDAVASTLYIVLPLLYIVAISRYVPPFDVKKLGRAFLALMPPIVAVGLVQYLVDDNFLVSTTYSETGGIINRNFLENATAWEDAFYRRLPSLLASADRLSAMGMMQFFFSVLLLREAVQSQRRPAFWLLLSLASSIAVLMIAGARSRILIIGAAIALAGIPWLLEQASRIRRQRPLANSVRAMVVLLAFAVGGGILATVLVREGAEQTLSSIPIIKQLGQTASRGDVAVRIAEAISESAIPDDVSMFGQGLGTAGIEGRPGEMAVRAMWIESGVFWTIAMLSIYAFLILKLAAVLLHAIRLRAPYDIVLSTIPFLLWAFGLMTGLSGAFELSTALTLFPAVAVMTSGATILPEKLPGAVGRLGLR